MKRLLHILFVLALVPVLSFSCENKEDEEPKKTAQELAVAILSGSGEAIWTVSGGGSVSKDGTSQTANFTDFEITFRDRQSAGLSYQTTGGGGLFDATGNWNVEGENYSRLRLSGIQPAANRDIVYQKNADDLRLEFTISAPENARTDALIGYYVFTLKPKN